MSRKTFYKYFDSLGEAVISAQSMALRSLSIAHPNGPTGTPLDQVITQLRWVAQMPPDHVQVINMVDFSMRSLGVDPEQQKGFLGEFGAGWKAFINVVHAGQRDGTIRADIEPHILAENLGRAVLGIGGGRVRWGSGPQVRRCRRVRTTGLA
ncbi:TetR/AcrR family transcriptional regulator [Frankia sp. AgB32]|uniref:TetR/AcrR family transcriptional regulator n=1 Tax=Frankia sp. AgB32 TaxID=631119 RepID=UPI00200EEDFC|nr:TetR/AcrR family transcriptional regulator [Frankia sp. AgB32]MCK9893495.1 hypothetical protein [Frankia sp. AgB32]